MAATVTGASKSICTHGVRSVLAGRHPPDESRGMLENWATSSGVLPYVELTVYCARGRALFPLFCKLVEHGFMVDALPQ